MLPVIIYCYEINFIVTSKSRALEKPLIVMDQLWHLLRMLGQQNHAAGGENGSIMVGMFVSCVFS